MPNSSPASKTFFQTSSATAFGMYNSNPPEPVYPVADNITLSTPANVPFENLVYYTAKNLNATYIVEILDLWPQTFVDLGIFSKWNPILFFSFLAEKWLYKKANKLIFSMEGGKDYIIEKKWDYEKWRPN